MAKPPHLTTHYRTTALHKTALQ